MQLVHEHAMQGCKVLLFGRQPQLVLEKRAGAWLNSVEVGLARSVAIDHGAQPHHIRLLRFAPNEHSPGHRVVTDLDNTRGKGFVYADGLILDQIGSAGIGQTADCPTVVISNNRTGNVMFAHCGRPALTPREGTNLLTQMLEVISKDNEDLDYLEVFITGAIAGKYFAHNNHDEIKAKALPFLDEFGPEVFYDVDSLSLDVIKVIRHILIRAGLEHQQISDDGLDTYSHSQLASHRQTSDNCLKRLAANTVIVIRY